jgi:uncharacterized membrane protein HdeD (DUF308 family)
MIALSGLVYILANFCLREHDGWTWSMMMGFQSRF